MEKPNVLCIPPHICDRIVKLDPREILDSATGPAVAIDLIEMLRASNVRVWIESSVDDIWGVRISCDGWGWHCAENKVFSIAVYSVLLRGCVGCGD